MLVKCKSQTLISSLVFFSVVICDTCHRGFHTYCLRPVMVNIPKEDWLCSACSGGSNNVSFDEYLKGTTQRDVLSFLGLPFHSVARFFKVHSDAINLFKEKSKNAVKQRAISLQIPSKQVTFEVGDIKFIRALESSDWKLPVPLLNMKDWVSCYKVHAFLPILFSALLHPSFSPSNLCRQLHYPPW